MNALETVGLTKRFRSKQVIQDLSLHVPRGEIYGFVGKNGSGKSTTMKLICGLMPASGGEVRVMGKSLAPCETSPRIGSLIEEPGLYLNLSAFDNLMIKALALGLVDPRTACLQMLATVGLKDTGKQKAKKFSLGMKQRLGMALALLGNPDILLLDEPFNGLDPEATQSMRGLLVRLVRERGVTVVISSHVLDQLERICTRYGVIRSGTIVRELTAEDVERERAASLSLSCSNAPRALALIEEHIAGARTTVLPGNELRITGPVVAEEIGRLLLDEGIAISDLHRTERDVETFFLELMNGPSQGAPTIGEER